MVTKTCWFMAEYLLLQGSKWHKETLGLWSMTTSRFQDNNLVIKAKLCVVLVPLKKRTVGKCKNALRCCFTGQLSLEHGPFIDIIATLVFAALINRSNKKRLHIQRSEANGALFDVICNVSGSAENVLFWSNNQKLLLDRKFKRLKLSSKFGTGMGYWGVKRCA